MKNRLWWPHVWPSLFAGHCYEIFLRVCDGILLRRLLKWSLSQLQSFQKIILQIMQKWSLSKLQMHCWHLSDCCVNLWHCLFGVGISDLLRAQLAPGHFLHWWLSGTLALTRCVPLSLSSCMASFLPLHPTTYIFLQIWKPFPSSTWKPIFNRLLSRILKFHFYFCVHISRTLFCLGDADILKYLRFHFFSTDGDITISSCIFRIYFLFHQNQGFALCVT